ncbi:MAG: Gfo/Idh/MocA family oxidoreductase [Planctomycetales bacterium]|nr:Gfo/Idh/MocA family oxidoreductase [Planctomycetales bacterium]
MSQSETPSSNEGHKSRRDFIRTGSSWLVAGGVAGSLVGGQLNIAQAAHSFGSDEIKVGLVGCGGRGTGAAVQALNTESGPIRLTAMGDAFADRVQTAFRAIKSQHGDKCDVAEENRFVGFDAYQKVLASDIDMVILATPPGFRPLHLEAAVEAGKHIFMEKPVAVDAPGVRRVLAASEKAKEKGLSVACGLQRHHEVAYKETIQQLQDGAIGDINFCRAYWNGGGVWVRPRQEGQTELEYQMRNWYYFNWLCGDHIVEQHIHNLDVINWLKGSYPVKCQGQGGREVRKGKDYGQIYDHHFVEYTYADGTVMLSQCRHIADCWNSVSEFAHGSQGHCDISGGKIYDGKGDLAWQTRGGRDGWQQEHHDVIADLRKGILAAEGEYGAMSTMTAIIGRMATYSGVELTMEQALASELTLCDVDSLKTLEDAAPLTPNDNGDYYVAVPGVRKDFGMIF